MTHMESYQVGKYYYTLIHLKPKQIYGRLRKALPFVPRINVSTPQIRLTSGPWHKSCAQKSNHVEASRFRFLNTEADVSTSKGWNNHQQEKLWLYNLHYFDGMNFDENSDKQAVFDELIVRWVAENPPPSGVGWEPYPVSRRIVNWVKRALSGAPLPATAIKSLAVQTEWLSRNTEIHLLGNHLIANAKAMIFSGLFFRGSLPERWLKKGMDIIACEVLEQVTADGGHYERSPMYHANVLEDFLDLINISNVYPEVFGSLDSDFLSKLQTVSEKMLVWLKGMTHPDAEIALFNDAAFGSSPPPEALFAYSRVLGLKFDEDIKDGVTHLDRSGYIRWQNGPVVALLDVGLIGPDFLPGHAHADTLSFEMSLFGQRLIVDTGTSGYEATPKRLYERGSAAHNTVVVDGENSSEVWSSFRVARRARPFNLSIDCSQTELVVDCCHDGYKRLKGAPVHRRRWLFKESSLIVKDLVTGLYADAVARFHFHPDVQVSINESSKEGCLRMPHGKEIKWKILAGNGTLCASTYSPEFGMTLNSQCLEVELDEISSSEIIFSWA